MKKLSGLRSLPRTARRGRSGAVLVIVREKSSQSMSHVTLLIAASIAYPELLTLAQCMSARLDISPAPQDGEQHIISLLCPTGPDFLVAWLALMGLGYGVVLVA